MRANGNAAEETFPPTYIVIEFSSRARAETAQWIVDKITKDKKKGGAELLIRAQPHRDDCNLTIHVSAETSTLLDLAEELELRKRDKYGTLREFTLDELDEFTTREGLDEFLTTSEKQTIVRHEIENIRALANETHVQGYSNCSLYEGQSIVTACHHYGIIKKIYPLHEEEEVRKLGASWYKAGFKRQPYEEIRLYFGESIALYFQFLGFYTISLVGPTILGFMQMFADSSTMAIFSILNIICATLFLELWRRKCAELAFTWGTITMTSFDEPRPNFRGTMGIDSVTGKLLPQAPRFKTNLKMYCVSLPLVIVCMFGAFLVMLLSFWVEDQLKAVPQTPMWLLYTPSVVYAGLIYVMNMAYRRFANFLTEWENHRTQSQFDRHRVTKLVLFEFVNNFMSLFYIAFIIQDMDLLRYQLATLLIVLQSINNIQEAFVPLVMRSCNSKVRRLHKQDSTPKIKESKPLKKRNIIELEGVKELDSEDSRIKQAVAEGMMELYDDPYDDYLELFVQFGYVFLFSAVYPMAAFWALANNFLEIRCDAFKLCCTYQRPMARKVKDTGAWQRAFQALSTLSVLTNCALLSLNPSLRSMAPELSPAAWYLSFVVLEHLLLGVRQILHFAIPDKPEWVRVALARGNYKAKQALKLQFIITLHYSDFLFVLSAMLLVPYLIGIRLLRDPYFLLMLLTNGRRLKRTPDAPALPPCL